jgi:hypothetical protein
MKTLIVSAVFTLFISSIPAFSQVGQDLKNAGADTKDAAVTGAKKTKNGTKKAYHATTKGVKKGVNKTATVTAKGADKVAGKTDTNPKP